MCLICIELIKQRMTLQEARKAAGELVRHSSDDEERDHTIELITAIDSLNLEKLDEVLTEGEGHVE